MFMAKMSPNTHVASSNEMPWSLKFDAAFFGSHSKLYPTSTSYRRLDRSDPIDITLYSWTAPIAVASPRTPSVAAWSPARLSTFFPRSLVTTRVAQLNGCEFRQDIKRAFAVRHRMGIERFDQLAAWRESPVFSAAECAALAFVEEASTTRRVSDAAFNELRRHFDDRQIAELTLSNAIENYYNLLNVPLEVGSDGLEHIATGGS